MKESKTQSGFCRFRINAVKDSMDILTGKWKIHILGTLLYGGKMRFMDLQRELRTIGPKMLTKELQDLEMNNLITRSVKESKPGAVEYDLTDFGRTLESVIDPIAKWGMDYRDSVIGKTKYEE
jgi:DNA-binding HxlR family transcriptional regulator